MNKLNQRELGVVHRFYEDVTRRGLDRFQDRDRKERCKRTSKLLIDK